MRNDKYIFYVGVEANLLEQPITAVFIWDGNYKVTPIMILP